MPWYDVIYDEAGKGKHTAFPSEEGRYPVGWAPESDDVNEAFLCEAANRKEAIKIAIKYRGSLTYARLYHAGPILSAIEEAKK